jgi:hypothetical protein
MAGDREVIRKERHLLTKEEHRLLCASVRTVAGSARVIQAPPGTPLIYRQSLVWC